MVPIPSADNAEHADAEQRNQGKPKHTPLPVRDDNERGKERA